MSQYGEYQRMHAHHHKSVMMTRVAMHWQSCVVKLYLYHTDGHSIPGPVEPLVSSLCLSMKEILVLGVLVDGERADRV